MRYLFGDTDIAARRLRLLAELFAESSWRFVARSAESAERLRLGVDLGCGGGHTSHLLARAAGCRRVVGLDKSDRFVRMARKTATSSVSFRRHDVTAVPFPPGSCDVLYCRLLLAHLGEVARLLAKWSTQLEPGGLMLVEEVETIRSASDVFATYIEIVEAMLADQGSRLRVGGILEQRGDLNGLRKHRSELVDVALTAAQAARLFHMNIQTWKHNEFVRASYSADLLAGLGRDLHELTASVSDEVGIVWGLRQIVYRRRK